MEWAIANQTLYLLQVRPITTHTELFPEMITEPGAPKKLYLDTIALSQGFDDTLSVLGGDIWAIVTDQLKRGSALAGL